VKPCPVNIDFGDVTVAMRNYLRKSGKRKFNPAVAAGMAFLNAKDPQHHQSLLHKGVIDAGFKAAKLGLPNGQKIPFGHQKAESRPQNHRGRRADQRASGAFHQPPAAAQRAD
jgi:hypothetical protein